MGPFADFKMTDEDMYELHIAAWMHDCGKVTTPVHALDKSRKLETIWDRIHHVKTRFELMKRDVNAILESIGRRGDQQTRA